MEAISIKSANIPVTFSSKRKKQKCSLYDVFIRESVSPPQKGLNEIKEIRAGEMGGTVCKGSIPMQNFVRVLSKDELRTSLQKGMSTNTDGIPHCFLKSTMDVPLSTSSVHDCSVMYLYNKKANTHFLYHAEHDCRKRTLDFMIREMMPEGIDGGAIIAGESYWHNRHESNMRNMFVLMKKNNPKAVVNVYHDSTQYPEIVGYKGRVFEIPNIKVLNQIKHNQQIADYGQASFKVSNIEWANTFERINYGCNSLDEVKTLSKEFKSQRFDNEVLKILKEHLKRREVDLNEIFACKTITELSKIDSRIGYSEERSFYNAFKKMYEILKNLK